MIWQSSKMVCNFGKLVSGVVVATMLTLAASTNTSHSQTLSPLALVQRCHALIVQSRFNVNTATAREVENGTRDPIQTCLSYLSEGDLGSDLKLKTSNRYVSQLVLRNFHRLHASWFQSKLFKVLTNNETQQAVNMIYDTSEPSFYITRALFDPNFDFKQALTTREILVSQRSTDNPDTAARYDLTKSNFIFPVGQLIFPDRGTLFGFESIAPQNWDYSYAFNGTTRSGTLPIRKNVGRGYFSTSPYLTMTVDEPATFKSDGGLSVPRKWARNVINDVLCRDLPVVRKTDADPFVVSDSSVAFRTQAACTRCHVTMDRMAYTIRGFRYASQGRAGNNPIYGGYFSQFHPVDAPAVTGWPAEPVTNFERTPASGHLFYRDYEGKLVDEFATNLRDLANKMAAKDDPYICLAKRYYNYFIGVDVNIGDPEDPTQPLNMTTADKRHRDNVIKIGKNLKQHLDPKKTIEEILKLPDFSSTGAAITRGLAGE